MKILFYGAGVIGQVYAAKLYDAGIDVTLLARGENYTRLARDGVTIHNSITKESITADVPLTQQLNEKDNYTLIIVTVRLDQLADIIQNLKVSKACSTLLFMLNNPKGVQDLACEFPERRIILGFPGIGGVRQADHIDYVRIKEQKTTFGNYNGAITSDIKQLKEVFQKAGFVVALEPRMSAWLIIHSVFICCASAAIILENGDSVELGRNRNLVGKMVKSINEGFKACKAIGLPIIPANLKMIFMLMPRWFAVLYWQKAMRGKTGTLAIAPHADNATHEMRLLARQVLDIVHSSSLKTPTLDELLVDFIRSK